MQLLERLSVLAVLTLAAPAPLYAQAPGAQAPGLPPGEGRDLVAVACTQCHGLNTIMAIRDGAAGWRQFVNYMIMKGAQVTDREADTVVQYLTASFGPNSPLPAGAPPPLQASLPSGAGKELVEARCVTCHDLLRVVAARRPRSDWDGIVTNMVNRGATATPQERQTMVSYLAMQFGE
jgi:mono/diheme cytochrome c family protein